MGDVNTWISDKLHDILGYSEPGIVSYILAIGKKHNDKKSLFDALIRCDLPSDDKTSSFANELLNKLPRSNIPQVNQNKIQEKKA